MKELEKKITTLLKNTIYDLDAVLTDEEKKILKKV